MRVGARRVSQALIALLVVAISTAVLPQIASAVLPDGRIYEQVTPPNKEGNFIFPGALLFKQSRGLGESGGNAVLYGTSGAVEGKSASGEVQLVISRHTRGTSWEASAAVPRQLGFLSLFASELSLTSPSGDFSKVLFTNRYPYSPEQPLEPQASENIYLSSDPLTAPLWLGKPQIENPVPLVGHNHNINRDVSIAGSTTDGSTVFFGSAGTLLAADRVREGHLGPQGEEGQNIGQNAWGLYEANNGVVSEAGELPNGQLSPYGAKAAALAGTCYNDPSYFNGESADNEISQDGTRLFFVSPDPNAGAPEPPQLYVRELQPDGSRRSVLVSRDELLSGAPAPSGVDRWENEDGVYYNMCGTYAYGSPDGSHVMFRSANALTADAPALTQVHVGVGYQATGGTFTLTVAVGANRQTTAPIAFNASAEQVQAAVEALGNVGAGNAQVTGGPRPYGGKSGAYDLTIRQIATVSGDGSGLTPSGGGEVNEVQISNSGASYWYSFDLATEKVTYLPMMTGTPGAASQDGSRVLFFEPSTGALKVWSAPPNESVQTIVELRGAYVSQGADRASSDGDVFEFQTRNEVPSFNNAGYYRQIYRYQVSTRQLDCVSCPPVGVNPTENAETPRAGEPPRTIQAVRIMSNDGSKIFFDSPDSLVGGDVNGVRDVYEWDNGSVFLISSGTSLYDSYYFDSSANGSDVFFSTEDGLVPSDKDQSGDIYDARIPHRGDFVPPTQVPCEGDVCQGPPSVPSLLTPPASSQFNGLGNIPPEANQANTPAKRTVAKKHTKKRKHKKKHNKKKHKKKGKAKKAKKSNGRGK